MWRLRRPRLLQACAHVDNDIAVSQFAKQVHLCSPTLTDSCQTELLCMEKAWLDQALCVLGRKNCMSKNPVMCSKQVWHVFVQNYTFAELPLPARGIYLGSRLIWHPLQALHTIVGINQLLCAIYNGRLDTDRGGTAPPPASCQSA